MASSSLCSSFASKTWNPHVLCHHKTLTPWASAFLRGDIQLYPPSISGTRRSRTRRSGVVASLGGLLGGIFKGADTGESTRQQYAATVNIINGLEPEISALSDSELRERTFALRERVQQGQSLDSILPVIYKRCLKSNAVALDRDDEAFAVVREASKRVLGLRPFDVQLIGGMVLHKGEIAEMRTGEGKTLVAVLPAYLNALSGKGVHVVTVNDYLARRDCEWVGQVPRFLGLKSVEDLVVRGFNYCIIDEVDSILIDEARTPLIISGPAEKPSDRYYKAAKIAEAFERDIHYTEIWSDLTRIWQQVIDWDWIFIG
ncbi:hypothetical protein V8G54_028680 [Vigna mungo]|uniref:chloroplast protein-transporting ATPase n=1 Tax=Vigna mungo TaxID=3915 RepID=A0AAQ3MTE5_VIGMU